MRTLFILVLLASPVYGEIVDSVVAIVGTQQIKLSDVEKDLRLTAFMNNRPPDWSPDAKQEATGRLIDQVIIRVQIQNGGYTPPDEKNVAALIQQVRGRYPSPAEFQRSLAVAGLTEPSLEFYLGWQLMVLEFIELRFGAEPDDPAQESNDEFISWLDEARKGQRITIRTERLQ